MTRAGWFRSPRGRRRAHFFLRGLSCGQAGQRLDTERLEPVTEVSRHGTPFGKVCAYCEATFRCLQRAPA